MIYLCSVNKSALSMPNKSFVTLKALFEGKSNPGTCSASPGSQGGWVGWLCPVLPRQRRETRAAGIPTLWWGYPQVLVCNNTYTYYQKEDWWEPLTNNDMFRARSLTTGIVVVPFQVCLLLSKDGTLMMKTTIGIDFWKTLKYKSNISIKKGFFPPPLQLASNQAFNRSNLLLFEI